MAVAPDSVPFSVYGKTALITGAGSGICLSFAKLLLSKQCNVVIADISLRPEAEEVVAKHSAKESHAPRAVFVKTDVTIWDDLTKAFDVADAEFGGIDIICPGAGVFEPHWSNFWHPPGSAKSKDKAHGDNGVGHYASLDINLTHPIRTTQIAISRWLNPAENSEVEKVSATNPKRAVLITSVAGQLPSFSTPLYAASKHAVSGFVRSLSALDQAIGVRVNAVAPGIIRTPLWTDHPEKMQMINEVPNTWIEPEEVAEAMLRCVEHDEIFGGYVMEVLKGATRNVDWKMDPGPQGLELSTNRAVMNKEALAWLAEPGWGTTR